MTHDDDKRLDDTFPDTPPLRRIVERRGCVVGTPDRVLVTLECGHTEDTRAGRKARVRCYKCLREARNAWDTAHTCPHGRMLSPGESCLECTLAAMGAEIDQLRAERDVLLAELAVYRENEKRVNSSVKGEPENS